MSEHTSLAEALAAAQAELKDPAKVKTAKAGSYTYKYTDIAGVLAEVRPVLSRHGIAVVQGASSEDGRVLKVTTSLLWGDQREFSSLAWPMPTDIQKLGSAITYLRRYALCAMVGVAADDDDGESAREPRKPARAPQGPAKSEGPPSAGPARGAPPRADTASTGANGGRHPSFDDAERKWFFGSLPDGLSYDRIKAWCAEGGLSSPSRWDHESRQRFLTALFLGKHPELYEPGPDEHLPF